jgi:hypothetical protein
LQSQTNNGAAAIDASVEPVKDLNDQFLAGAREAGNRYLDSSEKAVHHHRRLDWRRDDRRGG